MELDPNNPSAVALARRADEFVTSPALSATATGTPLTAGPAQ
jgi:hypothetical protein